MLNGSVFRGAKATCSVIVISSLAAAAFARAQEEPEPKPPTFAEAKVAFSKADAALNQAWSAAKKALTGDALAELTSGQRDWLKFRNDRAGQESEQAGEKDPKRSAIWHSIAAELSESRAEWLRGRARQAEPEENLSGVWVDSYGGTLQLVQRDAQLFFNVDVVRGPTYHTGGIAGIATWNQRIGWYSDKGSDPEKTDESNLAFINREGCLEVIGANTQHYHGARAYFDGLYCKAGTLDAQKQAELVKAIESGDAPSP